MKEEINLRELFSNMILFIYTNIRVLILFMVIGVILVVGFQKLKKPYYFTTAICHSSIMEYERDGISKSIKQRTAIDLINYLQIHIENEDYAALADLLSIDIKVAEDIKDINAEQLYQLDIEENYTTLNKFQVDLVVFDNSKIANIQEGLISYFSNNKYVNDHYNLFKESNKIIMNEIDTEIKRLINIRQQGADKGVDISSIHVGRASDDNQIISLNQMRETLKVKQQLRAPIVFIQGFARVDDPEDDILTWSLLSMIITSFIGVIFISVKKTISN